MESTSHSLTKKLLRYLIPFTIGIIFIAWIFIPMLYAILWSLVDPEFAWSYPALLPSKLSLYHWQHIFQYTHIKNAILNSYAIAFASMLISFLLALPTAFALGRYKLKGKSFYKTAMLFPVAFPGMAMAMFVGRLIYSWGLTGSYFGVIMGHVLVCLPYMLRVMTVSFESVPQEMIDAADNLGANAWTKFKEIYMPMILPGVVAGGIFSFITSIEEFNLSFIIGAPEIQTIPTILFSYLGTNFLRTSASVVSLILVVPNIIMLMITERMIKTEYMGAALGKM